MLLSHKEFLGSCLQTWKTNESLREQKLHCIIGIGEELQELLFAVTAFNMHNGEHENSIENVLNEAGDVLFYTFILYFLLASFEEDSPTLAEDIQAKFKEFPDVSSLYVAPNYFQKNGIELAQIKESATSRLNLCASLLIGGVKKTVFSYTRQTITQKDLLDYCEELMRSVFWLVYSEGILIEEWQVFIRNIHKRTERYPRRFDDKMFFDVETFDLP